MFLPWNGVPQGHGPSWGGSLSGASPSQGKVPQIGEESLYGYCASPQLQSGLILGPHALILGFLICCAVKPLGSISRAVWDMKDGILDRWLINAHIRNR